ncbi:MAG: galactonate dehydratase [Eubacteriales bacterium]|nr:galactonate dehydratase [Eubacteriales bacterium]
MKITGFETFYVKPRWLILKVYTDEGITGVGEPILECRAHSCAAAVQEIGQNILGEDPRRVEALWQRMYRSSFYRGGPIAMSAITGIEMALWDIKGKALGVPVYELLRGAVRDKIRMYTHVKAVAIKGGNTIDEMCALARKRLADWGMTALKYSIIAPISPIIGREEMKPHIERFAAVRDTIGDAVDLAIDFHGRVSPANAPRLIDALAPYHPLFIEEPVLPDNVDEMVDISRRTNVPLAAGERLFTRWGYRELIEKQAVRVLQPDLCHVGGIFEARKIAAMGEVYHMSIAPHNPLGPISLAACLQLDACTPNFLVQEFPGHPEGWDLGQELLQEPFTIQNGYIDLPKKPGLGVELNDAALEALKDDGWRKNQFVTYEDGSQADW